MNSSIIQPTDAAWRHVPPELYETYLAVHANAESSRSSLDPSTMRPAEYWKTRAEVTKEIQAFTEVKMQVCSLGYQKRRGCSESDWWKTEEAQNYCVELQSLKAMVTLCEKQAQDQTVIPGEAGNRLRRSTMQFWECCSEYPDDMRFRAAVNKKKLKMRKELLAHTPQRQDEGRPYLEFQCPIAQDWNCRIQMKVIQLFPYRGGQATMRAIFGPEADGELWSPTNGIVVSESIAWHLKTGLMFIVPDLAADATEGEIAHWHDSKTKGYKIKLVDRPHRDIGLSGRNIDPPCFWRHLNGIKVQFPPNSRPNSRYLHFFYLQSLLRQAWRFPDMLSPNDPVATELSKPYWGTSGYPEDLEWVISVTEAMGPSYKALVDKLIDSSDRAWVDVSADSKELNNVAQRDPSALAVASEHIAFETVGRDFDDCHSNTELDDWDNESIPELVEHKSYRDLI
ncbi:MAG: hypothetical protein Q9185_004725 [Variospora sp. 1 TL-2023]